MKAKEIRELSDAELEQKLIDTRQELFNLRFQSVTGALENPARSVISRASSRFALSARRRRRGSK